MNRLNVLNNGLSFQYIHLNRVKTILFLKHKIDSQKKGRDNK